MKSKPIVDKKIKNVSPVGGIILISAILINFTSQNSIHVQAIKE